MNVVQSHAPSPKQRAVDAFIEEGFTLIPLNGKIPAVKDWVAVAPDTYQWEHLAPVNYGVVLRAGTLVVDIDPRNFGWVHESTGEVLPFKEGPKEGFRRDDPVARLKAKVGSLSGTFIVRTGGGGLHIYLRKPADLTVVNALKEYPGIEFKSSGRQVVGPGSVHPDSGKEYEAASGEITKIADAPASLLALITQHAAAFPETGTGKYVNDAQTQGRFLAYLTDVAEPSVQGQNGDHNAFKVACHGRDLGLPPDTVLGLMLEHWNDRCTPPWTPGDLRGKVVNAYKFAKGAVGTAHASSDFEVVAPPPPPKLRWVTAGPEKRVVRCLQNCMNYLQLPPPQGGLYKVFAFNDFTGRIEFVRPAPWHNQKLPAHTGVNDHDLQLLRGYLADKHGYESAPKDIEDAITNVAYHERFHPVREYLQSLKWDGVKRIDTWMKDYLGAIDGGFPEYLAAVSRKVLCAAVMRVMKPGIQFHHVVVLEGAQDIGKSSTCSIMGGPFSSDATVDPHSRDTVDAMQGRWWIEMAEMDTVRKVDEDALKAFITRDKDRVRLAYGRSTGEYPRQSIFIGTKNPKADGTYLKDDTGNRRWWPVRCEPKGHMGQIDFKGLAAARNQLFAEAMALVKSPGEKLSMDTPQLKMQAAAVVAQRHAEHEWTESIGAWLARCDEKKETRRDFLTARDVFVDGLGGSDVRMTRRDMTAIAGVLRNMGWAQKARRVGERVVWGWERTMDLTAL